MKIIKLFIYIIIFSTFVLVGAPIEYNCFWLNVTIILMGVIFGIYKTIIKKEKIKYYTIDLIILIFYLTPLIPIIFGTCNSIEETFVALIKNISLFSIYFIVKNIIITNSKEEKRIIDVIIIGGLLLVVLGIDEQLSKTIFQYKKYLGILDVFNIEKRMFSTLGYANSFAIIMAIEIYLCFIKIKHNKVVYSGLIYLFTFGMLMSYSRAVVALFALFFMLYLISSKRKRVYITYIMLQNLILALITMKIYELLSKQYIFAWICMIVFCVLSIIITKIIRKNYRKICKIKSQSYVKMVLLLIIFLVVLYLIGISLKVPLHVFENEETNQEIRYKLYNIESEKEYNFEINFEANNINNIDIPVYGIVIAEENKYYDTIDTHEIQLRHNSNNEKITFTTTSETEAMVIYIVSFFPRYQNGLTINSLYINNKEYGLNYMYIPTQLVERIESFSFKHKSLWERFVYYKDAIKIIKQNVLFGVGANGWLYNYENVQSYKYLTTEVHNYALQIFIDNGILGFILLITIIIYAIATIAKKKRKISENDIAFLLLTSHALIDFDMSFYIIMLIWVILLAFCTSKS